MLRPISTARVRETTTQAKTVVPKIDDQSRNCFVNNSGPPGRSQTLLRTRHKPEWRPWWQAEKSPRYRFPDRGFLWTVHHPLCPGQCPTWMSKVKRVRMAIIVLVVVIRKMAMVPRLRRCKGLGFRGLGIEGFSG